jgi:hypothetical protein
MKGTMLLTCNAELQGLVLHVFLILFCVSTHLIQIMNHILKFCSVCNMFTQYK